MTNSAHGQRYILMTVQTYIVRRAGPVSRAGVSRRWSVSIITPADDVAEKNVPFISFDIKKVL